MITDPENTAVGDEALFSNMGALNTATGFHALFSNTDGDGNTATGSQALASNTTGDGNTATGAEALFGNTIGNFNTASGHRALGNNTTGSENTANGHQALANNTTGFGNAAVGWSTLLFNTTGFANAAVGSGALFLNTIGSNNTAMGQAALRDNTTGSNNTALGVGAGSSITGSGNVCIGEGVPGFAGEDDHTYIRNINTTSVSGGGADTVTVDLSTGLVGHLSSSRRHKEQIQPMANSSEVLHRLKPVTYRYKKDIDASQALDYGLVAEEVAEIDPNLTACNREGQIESVRYNAINAMLLNEFLKEHRTIEEQTRKIQEQEATIAQLKKEMETVVARLKEQDSKIQKVSDQLELSKPAPQMVQNR
jgi:hypothetical protein